jgi:hypothetical protein
MLWNEFIKLNHISKLSLNEQLRKFNEYIMYEEQVAGSIIQVPVTITIIPFDQGIVRLYRNNTLVLTQTNAGSKSTLLNPGNTFYIVFDNTLPYDAIRYILTNNGITINQFSQDTPQITSTTFTATAGSNYEFRCSGFST